MKNKCIAANWKMHGTRESIRVLTESLLALKTNHEVIIFPPFVFLADVQDYLQHSSIALGVQNIASELQGAYTGEVSASMLADFGCQYVLIGHSERRQLYHETNEILAKKFLLAQQTHLTPILCVGETADERAADKTLEVIFTQLEAILQHSQLGIKAFSSCLIAYEPVWAIGTGLTASPEQAQAIHAAIRAYLAQKAPLIAASVKILYGGSIKPDNAASLFQMPDIDGGLVGGASLDPVAFAKICSVLN